MKKKVTITLLTGFIALISGLILCGIGYFMGGIEDIKAIATPNLIEETYQDIHEIRLDSTSKDVRLEQSPDDQFHVRYSNVDNFHHQPLKLQQVKQTLTVEAEDAKLHIKGIMQFLGQELAFSRNRELQELVILVPKEKTIEKLSGGNPFYNSYISLNNIHINYLDWAGYISGDNVTMESGTIHSSNIGSFYFSNSHLKNMMIDAPVATQSYQTSTLENVTIQNASSIFLNDTTIIGTTKVETVGAYHSPINVDLSAKSKKDTQLDLTITYDWEKLYQNYYYPSAYTNQETDETTTAQEEAFRKEHLEQMGIRAGSEYKDLKIEENKDGAKAVYTPKDAPNKLIIQTTNELIILGTLKSSH
ncbi:DUF4097 family beta strand repeat-containing protein [Streptococcus acidominimus]|uniref:DUF4097 domain-containing protein n=2 Tax=Streptococcus acidominimus TaxID=1326 RepID=A0A4Y9FK15_STRAI|nr:DUF4097 family beta strand repeat-containing protein [Streptococcus acidominimus]MBF0819824.1 DUF4097 family beta strand repeat protein [Streptococcus acidominimus]MBF0838697.1 DUF4097 family beta strand repeat protein [Streptococcus acidominimus]MBF0846809.1 DUF4097 family beta strand repeat protein [Streptococcus danieliae]TFU29396.1 hypothetical protein E4U01_10250 [Streptococcus acidominimus]